MRRRKQGCYASRTVNLKPTDNADNGVEARSLRSSSNRKGAESYRNGSVVDDDAVYRV
jgi:hypothetical protein